MSTPEEPTYGVRDLAAALYIDHQQILRWIEKGYVFSTAERGKNAKHRLIAQEATILDLMIRLVHAGLTAEHASHAARGMVLAGPKGSYKLAPGYSPDLTITRDTKLPTPANVYTWRARMTDDVILTIETPNPAYPLARTRSSD